MSESIKVILKAKSIQLLVDFCIEEQIEFSARPQAFPDTDWEFNLMVKEIKTAVLTGMFLRENRIDIPGTTDQQKTKKPVAKKVREEEEKSPAAPVSEAKPENSEDKPEDKGLF